MARQLDQELDPRLRQLMYTHDDPARLADLGAGKVSEEHNDDIRALVLDAAAIP
jgi:hypothetical protein